MSNRTPPRDPAKKKLDENLLQKRPNRPRAENRTGPNSHLGAPNELGIRVPSNDIEDYMPGLNNTANLLGPGVNYRQTAEQKKREAHALYARQRANAMAKLEENQAGAPPQKRPKPNGTARRRKSRSRRQSRKQN